MKKNFLQKLKTTAGVSTLPTMLLLGSIIIEIVVAMAFLTYYFNTLNFSARLTSEALETARAGAQDGINKVILDKNCCGGPYTVTTSNGRTATVNVCKDVCLGAGQTRVLSTATVFNKQRTIEADLSVDPVTGQVAVNALKEI